MTPELLWAGATVLAGMLDRGEISSVEVTEAFLARSEEVDGALGTYLARTPDGALAAARAADERRAAGEPAGRFDGIPVAYKDIFCTDGVPTTAGSKILEGFVPPYSATVVERCTEAGLPMLGKLNMDEFAMGSSN